MLRPVLLRRYIAVMRSKGFRPEAAIMGLDIDIDMLGDENYLIDLATYHDAVGALVALSGDEGIGFDVGMAHQIDDFGVLAYASMSGVNQYRNTDEIWNRYGATVGIMTRLSMIRTGNNTVDVNVDVTATTEAVRRFFVEELVALYFSIGADWVGRPPVLKRASFDFARPKYVQRYQSLLNCPLKFGAAQTRLTFCSDWFDEPLKATNPELKKLVEKQLTALSHKAEANSSLVLKLHDLFRKHYGRIVTLEEAARSLKVSTRTLSRQLQSRGHNYQNILNQYLTELAKEMLHRGAINSSVKQISSELGFSDTNAFRRAFKRWTGMTVQEYRNRSANA